MRTLGELPSLRPFYLAGGTALALRLGHRLSLDLDLFAQTDELGEERRRMIVAEVRSRCQVELIQNSALGLLLKANGQPASFFSYSYPLLQIPDEIDGLRVAGVPDIGLMKLDAIAGRGERKDFHDVLAIARLVPLDELFRQSETKYPTDRWFRARVLSALVDFDAADQGLDPTLLTPVEWQTVKEFFQTEATRLTRQWLNLTE